MRICDPRMNCLHIPLHVCLEIRETLVIFISTELLFNPFVIIIEEKCIRFQKKFP